MEKYEYGRIRILAKKLSELQIDKKVIDQIMAGGKLIRKSTKPEKKAGWMDTAMRCMDKLLDKETRHTVRELCACCLGGKRLKLSKAIFKNNSSLEQRIKAANETKFVFGYSVELQNDRKIAVAFYPEGLPEYKCVCLPKAKKPLPITYCYCCGGHVKHHLQIATGLTLKCTVRSSALSSGGKKPCTFIFSIQGK